MLLILTRTTATQSPIVPLHVDCDHSQTLRQASESLTWIEPSSSSSFDAIGAYASFSTLLSSVGVCRCGSECVSEYVQKKIECRVSKCRSLVLKLNLPS